MITIYMKRGCPYCEKVLNHIKKHNLEEKTKIYYVEEDFTRKEFKDKYGENASFPRGYLHKGEDIILIGGSDEIIKELNNHS